MPVPVPVPVCAAGRKDYWQLSLHPRCEERRHSPYYTELLELHLSKTLLFPECLEPFQMTLNEAEVGVLKLWLDAHSFEGDYTSLASGWPSDASVQVRVHLCSLICVCA